MSGISKDFITTSSRSSSHFCNEGNRGKADAKRFKEALSCKKEKESKEEQASTLQLEEGCIQALPMPPSSIETFTSSTSTQIGPLSIKEIDLLFEKMASTMIVMSTSGEEETTFLLEGDRFANSAFFGTRVTIKEFSTAPKIFNIEIASHSTALQLLVAHTEALMAAFEGGKFSFSVNRLDTQLLTSSELHAREQSDKEENPDHNQGDT